MLDTDLDEYLTEYRLQTPTEPTVHYEDGELEAQWLVAAGFSQLTKAFQEGRELTALELKSSVAGLPSNHAEAVKQRVKALNKTVRGRTRSRHPRKPDIRDVFRDADNSSTGTRSRSATPDSLDSVPGSDQWNNQQPPSFVSIFDNAATPQGKAKQNLRRTPSAPLRGSADLFRGSHIRCDIPFYTSDGIELLGFQRLGTVHLPRIRSGSDPSCSIGRMTGSRINGARSHSNLFTHPSDNSSNSTSPDQSPTNSPSNSILIDPYRRSSHEPLSFESICNDQNRSSECNQLNEPGCDVGSLSESNLKKLQPLLWLELASLFDKHQINLDKRKPFKRKRKEEGNLFGVSLNALVRRDQQVTGEDSSLVPMLLQDILNELTIRGAREEGILRIPGNKQRTEFLYVELEKNFYLRYDTVNEVLSKAGVHDLSTLLKRWLRELPMPLLATELVHLFYQSHAIPPPDQHKAISVLCLLLPDENRNTLRAILQFLKNIISLQSVNKMSLQNVATIIAPSLFPPRFVHPCDKADVAAQVRMAAQCCQLASVLIANCDNLWTVPHRLIDQAKTMTKYGQRKRQMGRRSAPNINECNLQR